MGKVTDANCGFYPKDIAGCGDSVEPDQNSSVKLNANFLAAVIALLKKQKSIATLSEMQRFAFALERSIRQRSLAQSQFLTAKEESDILFLIRNSVLAGATNEALWRCFLAAASTSSKLFSNGTILWGFCV